MAQNAGRAERRKRPPDEKHGQAQRHETLFWTFAQQRAMRAGDGKLVSQPQFPGEEVKERVWLSNPEADSFEPCNLAGPERPRVAGLTEQLQAWENTSRSAAMKTPAVTVQIFGVKSSQATRAAERFFKERRIPIQMMDLKQRPMAPAEIRRFTDRFGLLALVDTEGKPYVERGLKYLKMADAEWLARIEREPLLLRLPLVRSGHRLSVGHDEAGWKAMLPEP
jgi:arsenate reductase-like glutaredoxin family protein